MGHADNSQAITMGSQGRRDDRHSVARFGHGKERVRSPALKLDVRHKAREAARGVESPAKYKLGIEKKQWIGCEAPDVDCSSFADE